ncbi:1-phosphofructokinase [Paenibacillus hemerocallicola]|uniref:Tagatose-6-phosphate kinase n=1 Tax=Paenibacillus hemerocallicola TaxID=1172614 RepID=A0A5C4T9T3_9BACL|nr:1-phosphofructokinase [Paenibacillus hemerocallicola]TNJ65751.1 1-phosphofructokinase [Paenibacillus hemerocallicola]
MALITTVTLNAAIDKTYVLDSFPLGRVSRVSEMISVPGGKGINVARVVSQLGGSVKATGFVGGSNGDYIVKELGNAGIDNDFVTVEGESRLCLNMIDISAGTSTELLEPGPIITAQQIEAIKDKVKRLAADSVIVAFSGSLPKGAPAALYADLVDIAKAQGAKAFLDTSGDALIEGVKARPFFIKPNEDEIGKLLGRKPERESDMYAGMMQLMERGVGCVVVTLGAAGSVAGYAGRLYRIRAPRIEAINPVGSGDSFVAGMAVAVASGEPVEQALRLATASGTANALNAQAGDVRVDDVRRLVAQVQIESIV